MSEANTKRKKHKRAHDGKCGGCEYFDGDASLDDHGHGMGQCCVMPPVWLGPTDLTNVGELFELLDDFWQHPMVGVASYKCCMYKRRKKKAWWDK